MCEMSLVRALKTLPQPGWLHTKDFYYSDLRSFVRLETTFSSVPALTLKGSSTGSIHTCWPEQNSVKLRLILFTGTLETS